LSNTNYALLAIKELYNVGAASSGNNLLREDGGQFRSLTGEEQLEVATKKEAIELVDLRAIAISSVEQFATQTRELIAGKADQYKVGGWQGKRDRAMRIKQDITEDDDIAIVQREADKRGKGETVEQLVELQLTRARNLALGTSDIDGTESAAKTRVKAANNKTELSELMLILKQEADQYIADLKTELAQN
jgi:hypothetical protein